jgi:hypothetical protein
METLKMYYYIDDNYQIQRINTKEQRFEENSIQQKYQLFKNYDDIKIERKNKLKNRFEIVNPLISLSNWKFKQFDNFECQNYSIQKEDKKKFPDYFKISTRYEYNVLQYKHNLTGFTFNIAIIIWNHELNEIGFKLIEEEQIDKLISIMPNIKFLKALEINLTQQLNKINNIIELEEFIIEYNNCNSYEHNFLFNFSNIRRSHKKIKFNDSFFDKNKEYTFFEEKKLNEFNQSILNEYFHLVNNEYILNENDLNKEELNELNNDLTNVMNLLYYDYIGIHFN